MKLKDYMNSAENKFNASSKNEINLLFINWSYWDVPMKGYLEAWRLMTNRINGILTNRKAGKGIGVIPEAYQNISAVIVYSQGLEGMMFNDFRYAFAGDQVYMWVLDESLRDQQELLRNLTGLFISKPDSATLLYYPS